MFDKSELDAFSSFRVCAQEYSDNLILSAWTNFKPIIVTFGNR